MITIITVTYNASETLERTLRSVEEQAYDDIEHIIQDGASKDETLAIAESYRDRMRARGVDVKVISGPDNGLYDAMNKALSVAKGRFVCFLNAGDRLHDKNTLRTIADAVRDKNDVGVVYGDTDIVDSEGKKIRGRRLTPPRKLTWRSFMQGMVVCHQSFYVNREIAEEYELSYRFSSDFDWCVRVMRKAQRQNMRLLNVNHVLTDYLSEGMTTANHKASLKERFAIMSKHYGLVVTFFLHVWFVIRSFTKK